MNPKTVSGARFGICIVGRRQKSFSYDLNGNRVSSTDRKGQVTSLGYDRLNRLVFVGFNTVINGGTTTYESTISYTYDAANRMTQAADSSGGTITKTYDDVNRVVTETTAQGSISYSYDSAGRRASMTVAGQPQVSYSYYNANRLSQITQGASTVGFNYDNANRRSSLTLPNGITATYSYDNDSHLTGITYQLAGNTLGNLSYSYDSVGRRSQVTGSFARTGLPSAVTSAAYDAANELTNWNGTAIPYDSNGSMLSDGRNSFTWNARNQVATLNGVSLQYDAFGRRIKNPAGTSFLFDGGNATQELSGTTPTANLWTGGTDEFFQRSDSNGAVVPLVDALGSTLALANSSGSIVTTYSYDPFGNTTTAGTASANPSQYTGRENDGNGLYYYRDRYVETIYGRFISEDPIGFSGGINKYAYAGNAPTDFVDPFGTDKEKKRRLWKRGNIFTPDMQTCITPYARRALGREFRQSSETDKQLVGAIGNSIFPAGLIDGPIYGLEKIGSDGIKKAAKMLGPFALLAHLGFLEWELSKITAAGWVAQDQIQADYQAGIRQCLQLSGYDGIED